MIMMKSSISFLFSIGLTLIAFATIAHAIGQESQPFDPTKFKQHLATTSNTEAHDIIRAAFGQRNVEALVTCIDVETAVGYFADEYEASKDDDLKFQLALQMLRSETIFKSLPPLAIVRSGESTKYFLMRMIVSPISERLGNVGSAEELVADAKLRLRVADRLEASINGLPLKSPEPRPSKKSLPPETSSSAGTAESKTLTSHAATGDSQLSATSTTPWVFGILALLLVGALALKHRALWPRK